MDFTGRTETMAESEVCEGGLVTKTSLPTRIYRDIRVRGAQGSLGNSTNPPHHDVQIQQGGGRNCWYGGRSVYRGYLWGGCEN